MTLFSPIIATGLIFGLICLLKVRIAEAKEDLKPPDWNEYIESGHDALDDGEPEVLDIEENNNAEPQAADQVLHEPGDIQYRGQGLGFAIQNQNPPSVGDTVVVREGRRRGRTGVF